MRRTSIIKCSTCQKEIRGEGITLDELARREGWQKSGHYYMCPGCSNVSIKKGKDKVTERDLESS